MLASTVHHVTDNSEITHSKNEEIACQFQRFYSKLFNLRPDEPDPVGVDNRVKLIWEFLSRYSPSPLTCEDVQELEAPLSLEEWGVALKSTKPGKSPGPDGFSAQYYKCFSDLLALGFLKAFNSFFAAPCSSNSLLEACITVIPKDNKDPANVATVQFLYSTWTLSCFQKS